jgi:hypothetical protein
MMTQKDFDIIIRTMKEAKVELDLDAADDSPSHEPPTFWRGHNEGMDYAYHEVLNRLHNTFANHYPRFSSDKWCEAFGIT